MERTFTIPQGEFELPMKVYEPDFGSVTRCIVAIHGLCGHKDSFVLQSISEEMGIFGAATVRFDLPCHGESPMTERELSLDNCHAAILTAARWAQENYPDVPKCVFATGFGAFLTTHCLEALRIILGDVRLVMQTPDFRMSQSLLALKDLTEPALRKMGRVFVGRPGDRRIEVTYGFYEELRGAMTYAEYDMPMLLIHGECDEAVPLEDVVHFRRINDQAKLVIIPGADHQFRGAGQWDMVVDLTRDWFEFEQVTLCDCE
jgi:alpha/beta superfamily hydrolase